MNTETTKINVINVYLFTFILHTGLTNMRSLDGGNSVEPCSDWTILRRFAGDTELSRFWETVRCFLLRRHVSRSGDASDELDTSLSIILSTRGSAGFSETFFDDIWHKNK